MILSSSMYEKTYLQGFLEGVLEVIQGLASSGIHTSPNGQISYSKLFTKRESEEKERILIRFVWAP